MLVLFGQFDHLSIDKTENNKSYDHDRYADQLNVSTSQAKSPGSNEENPHQPSKNKDNEYLGSSNPPIVLEGKKNSNATVTANEEGCHNGHHRTKKLDAVICAIDATGSLFNEYFNMSNNVQRLDNCSDKNISN